MVETIKVVIDLELSDDSIKKSAKGKDVDIKHNQGDGRIFTGETATAIDNLRNSEVDEIIGTNTIPTSVSKIDITSIISCRNERDTATQE